MSMSIGKASDVPGAQGSSCSLCVKGPECVTPASRLQQERSEGGDDETRPEEDRTQVTRES